MKLILKNADFSQSGIIVPYEFILIDGKVLIVGSTGTEIRDMAERCVNDEPVSLSYNKITNTSSVSVTLRICFYADNSSNLKIPNFIALLGTTVNKVWTLQPNESLTITGGEYVDGDGNLTSITSAHYYRICVTNKGASGLSFVAEAD